MTVRNYFASIKLLIYYFPAQHYYNTITLTPYYLTATTIRMQS